MESKKINVSLYGGKSIFGGREQPLEADIIFCDKYDKCSYYKNNECLKVRSFASSNCKFGKKEIIRGYTSKAKKYWEFKNKYKNHEVYNILKYPSGDKLGIIDNTIIFPYAHVYIDEEYNLRDPYLSFNKACFIPKNVFTVNFIYKLCKFRPNAMMGGEIKDYQNKIVPLFLAHLKEVIPELYSDFVNTYKEFDKEINHIGRRAILRTINPSNVNDISKRYPNLDSSWYWDGEYLNYKSGYVSNISFLEDYKVASFKLKPGENTIIKIEDNSQVNENTIFID